MKPYVIPFLRATLAGVLIAVFLPFLFAAVLLIASIATGEPTQALVTIYVFTIVLASIMATIAGLSLLIGLPISFLLKRLGLYTRKAHLVTGVALGFISFPGLIAMTGSSDSDASLLILYVYAALAGGVTADSWWRSTIHLAGQEMKSPLA